MEQWEEWLRALFSGFGGNLIIFFLGLIMGGGIMRGIDIKRGKRGNVRVRAGKKDQVATDIDNSTVEQDSKKDGGSQVAYDIKKSKVKQTRS